MQPNSQPTPEDIASVAAHLGEQPAPQPQMQPEAPVSQPAPTQAPTDPFASMFASEPANPAPVEPVTAPTEVTQPSQPTEPTPQPTQTQQPTEPQPTTPQTPAETVETYDEYIARVTADVPQVTTTPDPESVDPNDPAAIKSFFDDLVASAVEKAEAKSMRQNAIVNAERAQWDSAFEKYGTLRDNKDLRDMVHNIRMGHFQRGIAITPTQAADKLLASLGHERRAGAADQQVVTTYESVQPNGGGSGAPVETSLDAKNSLTAVQDGGEAALAQLLDKEIKAGRTW